MSTTIFLSRAFHTAQLAVWGDDSVIHTTGGPLRLLRGTFNGAVIGGPRRVYSSKCPGELLSAQVPEPR